MQQRGYLQFEDQSAERRGKGSIDFEAESFVIKVGEAVVSEVPSRDVKVEALGNALYRIEVEGNRLLFEAEDESGVDEKIATYEFRSRLKPPQPKLSPVPATAAPAPIERRAPPPAVIHPPKNPGVAAVLSFLWPGIGQIYNGQILKAIIFIVVQVVNPILTTVLIGFLMGLHRLGVVVGRRLPASGDIQPTAQVAGSSLTTGQHGQ